MCIAQWASLQLHSSMTGRAGGASGVPPAWVSLSAWYTNPAWTRNPRKQIQQFRSRPCGLTSVPHIINNACGRTHQHSVTLTLRQRVRVTNQKPCHSHTCLHAKRWQTSFYALHCKKLRLKKTLWFVVWRQKRMGIVRDVCTDILQRQQADNKQ